MDKKVKEKECEACGAFFIPYRSNGKYCPSCSSHSDRVKQKVERQIRKNIKKYGYGAAPKEIKNICKECGKIFISYVHPKDFCSKECGSTYRIKHTFCGYCHKPMTETENIYDVNGKTWFCCEECSEKNKWDNARKLGEVKICPNCGKEFIKKSTYCSKECYIDHMHKKKRESSRRKAAGLKLCPVCGKEFAGEGVTCSNECKKKKLASEPCVIRKCIVCGKTFKCPVSRLDESFNICSDICQKKLSIVMEKEKQQKQEEQMRLEKKKGQEYINKNGLCSICKTSYVDCKRMQSGFRCYPKGSSCKGNLVIKCPKFTR